MTPLERVRAELPKCRACACPATLWPHPDDEDEDVLRCVGCGSTWDAGSYDERVRIGRVELRYLRDTRQTTGDLQRVLRAELDRDAARARALFVAAGKRIPSWLEQLERGAA